MMYMLNMKKILISVHHRSQVMMTSDLNIFRVTSPLCGESTGHLETPLTNTLTRSFDIFFGQRLNKRLSKQSRRRWFETPLN